LFIKRPFGLFIFRFWTSSYTINFINLDGCICIWRYRERQTYRQTETEIERQTEGERD